MPSRFAFGRICWGLWRGGGFAVGHEGFGAGRERRREFIDETEGYP